MTVNQAAVEQGVARLRRDVTVKDDPVVDREVDHQRLQTFALRSRPDELDAQARSSGNLRDGLQQQTQALLRLHAPDAHDRGDGGPHAAPSAPADVEAVGHHLDGPAEPEQRMSLLARGGRHGDDRATLVDAAAHRPLERAAESGDRPREMQVELRLMNVVQHPDHRRRRKHDGGAEERDAVLEIEDRVDASPVAKQPGERERVHAEPVASAHDHDSAPCSPPRLTGRTRGHERDPRARLDELLGNRMAVHLRATSLRMLAIAPVEHHYVAPANPRLRHEVVASLMAMRKTP